MKRLIPIRRFVTVTAAAVLACAATSAFAQPQGGPGGRGGGGGLPNATEEQTAALRELNQSLRPQLTKVSEARTELYEAIFAEKVDQTAIKAKAEG